MWKWLKSFRVYLYYLYRKDNSFANGKLFRNYQKVFPCIQNYYPKSEQNDKIQHKLNFLKIGFNFFSRISENNNARNLKFIINYLHNQFVSRPRSNQQKDEFYYLMPFIFFYKYVIRIQYNRSSMYLWRIENCIRDSPRFIIWWIYIIFYNWFIDLDANE